MPDPADLPTEREWAAADPTEPLQASGGLPTVADLGESPPWPATGAAPGRPAPSEAQEPVIEWPDVRAPAPRRRGPAIIVAVALAVALAILLLRIVSS